MKCTEIRENLAAYLDGEIDGAPRRSMDAHFAACPACLAERKAQAAAWRLLDLAGDGAAAPANQRERILARARASGGPGGGRVLRFPLPAVAAAAAILLVAGGAALHFRGKDAPVSPPTGVAPVGGPPDQLLENLAMLESLDLLQDDDVTVADSLSDYPVDDLETLGG